MQDTILRLVNSTSGIVAQKLLLDMMAEYGNVAVDIDKFNATIEELVNKGKIIRVQYVIPPDRAHCNKMRTGALYLPERSVVVVNQAEYIPYKNRR